MDVPYFFGLSAFSFLSNHPFLQILYLLVFIHTHGFFIPGKDMVAERKVVFPRKASWLSGKRQKENIWYEEQQSDQHSPGS